MFATHRSNQAMEPTATRYAFTFRVVRTSSLRITRSRWPSLISFSLDPVWKRHRKLLLASATAALLMLAAIVVPFFHRIEFFGAHYAVFISGDIGNRTYLAQGFHCDEQDVNYLGAWAGSETLRVVAPARAFFSIYLDD